MAYKSKICLLLLCLLESNCFAANFLQTANVTAVEGSPVDLICKSENGEPIEECIFTVPGYFDNINLFKNIENDNYKFVGEGLSAGQCGVRLLSIERKNTGTVTCSLEIGNLTENAQIHVTVLYPVNELSITSNNYTFKDKEEMEFNCSSNGGFPAPVLFLSIGDEILNSTKMQQKLLWKGPSRIEHNGLKVNCCAEQHNILLSPTTKCISSTPLNIHYSPQIENKIHEVKVKLVLGKDSNITVNIHANPTPTKHTLTKNGQEQADKLIIHKSSRTAVSYTWTISKVQLHDTKSNWSLYVENDIGNTTISYHLSLPESPESPRSPLKNTPTTPPNPKSESQSIGVGKILLYLFLLALLAIGGYLIYQHCDCCDDCK